MKAEDVPAEWMAAFSDGWARNGVRGGIAAVAPLIAAAEREACALIADEVCDPYGVDGGFSAMAIAAAIRTRSDAP